MLNRSVADLPKIPPNAAWLLMPMVPEAQDLVFTKTSADRQPTASSLRRAKTALGLASEDRADNDTVILTSPH
eukprot:4872177-Alexandrium_andersonii.AAC.1